MKFTPLQVAMGVSLLVHGGVVLAVHELRQDALGVPVPFFQQRALEIEIVSELEPEVVSRPAPIVAMAAETPKPLPKPAPASLLPENKSTDLPVAERLPVVIDQPIISASPMPEPIVELETRTVSPSVQVKSENLVAKSSDGGTLANYLVNPKPAYPVEARRRREEGLVVLAVQVNREGFPSRIQIVQSSKFQLLDEAAVRAVNQWQFTPARIGQLAVVSQIEVPIYFKLTGY